MRQAELVAERNSAKQEAEEEYERIVQTMRLKQAEEIENVNRHRIAAESKAKTVQAELEVERQRAENTEPCVVCMENPKVIMLEPCHHVSNVTLEARYGN